MPFVGTREPAAGRAAIAAFTLILTAAGCAMAGLGGSLQLNITDQQIRQVTIEVDGGNADARVLEVDATGEVELGAGRVTIERYVLHRTSFGSSGAVGYFLCAKPCANPLLGYVVAYSPEQIFVADGQLELRFRIVGSGDMSQELTRTIAAEMLPSLWQSPRIEARAGGGRPD